MKMRITTTLMIIVMLFLATAPGASAGSAPWPPVGHPKGVLQPGVTVTYQQKVPVNIVFIGYDRQMVDKNVLLDGLSDSYAPVVRYPQFYGLSGRDMGLKFTFDYRVTFTNPYFTNRFFSYLKQIGEPGDLTDYQTAYNDEDNNVLDVTGPVLYIDGPKVEQWLARNLGMSRGYTLVMVNWYGRPDFKFHVYTKTDEPDPDTGYNFGELRETRKMIAWGGEKSRLWFYDLSAGPEAWTDNWNVDDPDLDGNGVEDYRMPPIWEYTSGGYRDPSALSADLSKVTRYVGINLLFTSSPLYDPLNTAPGVHGDRVVHITMLEDDPASSGLDWIDREYIRRTFASFQPYYDWRVKINDINPIDPGAQRAFRIFTGVLEEEDCWVDYGDPFAQLFCYFDANLDMYVPDYGPNDYVAPFFAFNTTGENLGDQFGLLGFADDNWVDGTQSYVFEFDSAEYRDLGYGFSTTTTHEGGHHFGMSHPHDGYDSETGVDYSPADEFYFVWSGDESDTIMHYISLSNGFGQFDRDNMYRWEMAGYLNWANGLLDDIQAHPAGYRQVANVRYAQLYAARALASFHAWNYRDAAASARRAYEFISRAAGALGIEDQQLMMLRAAATQMAPHEGDPIRFPDN